MSDRIIARGENHQALVGDVVTRSHEEILWMFLKQVEELEEDEVDEIVEMGIEDSLEEQLEKAIEGCVQILRMERPSKKRVEEALEVVKGYKPKTQAPGPSKKAKTPRYYGFLPEVDLQALLDPIFSTRTPDEGKAFWEHLLSQKSVTNRPHITIVHKNSLPVEQEIWDRCMAVNQSIEPPSFKFKLGHIVWNESVMALSVDDIELESPGVQQEGAEFVSKLAHDIRERLHITVGTKEGVPAIEAMSLVATWRKNRNMDGVGLIELNGVSGNGGVKGVYG